MTSSDQMHYATYGRSRYRRKNNVNTKATSYEKSARRVASKQSSSSDNAEKKKNKNQKEMLASSWGQHVRTVAKDGDPPTVITDDNDNSSSRQPTRHRSASPATVSSSLRDSYVSSSSTSPTLQSTSCSGCSSSNQSSYNSDSFGSSVYSEDDSIYSNGSEEEGSYSSKSYHTSPTIDQDTTATSSSSYSASIGYKRSLTWNGKTSHPHTATTNNSNNRSISSSFVHKSNHYNELNNGNGKENSGRTIAAKKWLGFDMLSKRKNLIAKKKKKFSFGSSKHSTSDSGGSGDEGSVYEENSEEDGSVESGEGSNYDDEGESIHSSINEESQGSYATSSDESSIGSNISTTQYESKPSFLRSSMKKIGTTSNQCKKVLSNVKIPMLISGSSCKKMMMKKQSLLHDSYEGSFNDMNLSNYLSKTKKSLEQHQSTIAPNDDGYTDGSMTYCSSSDGRISCDVEDGGEDEEGEGKDGDSYNSEVREENEVCSGSDRYNNVEQVEYAEQEEDVAEKIKNDDADESSSMIQQKLNIEEECIIEELLHENERLYKKIAMLLSEREERASGTNTQEIVQSSTSNTLVEKEDDKAPTEEDNDDKQALVLEDTDKDREEEDINKALVLEDKDKDEEDSQVNLLTADENDTSSTRLLTDEHVADSHTKCLDEIATLINGIGILPSSSSSSTCVSMNTKAKDIIKEQKDTMGDEILKLVSKILSQRVVGVSPDTAPPQSNIDPPQVNDVNDSKVDPPPSEEDFEDVKTSPPRRSSSDCSVASSVVSPEQDRSTSSASTPYIVSKMINEMSSNSLFDSSPSIYNQELSKGRQRKFDFEDSESTLEIVYEYYSDWSSDESRGTSSSSSYQRSRYTSASEHVDMPPRGYHRYSPSPSRSRHRSRSRSASKSRSSSSRYVGSRSNMSSSSKSSTPKKFKSSSYKRSTPKTRSTSSKKGSSRGKRCTSKPGSSSSPPVENIKASEAKDENQEDTLKAEKEQDTLPQTNQGRATNSASSDERPSTNTKEDNVVEIAKREEQLSSAIDKHLKSIQDIMTKQPQVKNEEQETAPDLSCALSATSDDNTNTSRPSLGSQSTRERKGISISVISRRSSRIGSSSSSNQTQTLTFFIPTLTKKQIDGVLEELLETRETVTTNQVADGANKASKNKKRKKYQGEYNEEGQRHGYGIYTSKNGNQYRGEWQHDQREGLGVVKIGQGDVFEGQFKGNLKNGVGVYHYDDGECDLSRYVDDTRVGDTVRYSDDRQHAFLLSSEQGSRRISLEEAVLIAKEMGTIVASKASSTS